MTTNPWRPSRPYPDQIRKRPYSPHGSPSRSTRLRNAIHRDVLFEQGPIPLFAQFSSRGSRAVCCFRNGFLRVWNVDPVHDRFLDCEQVLRHPEIVFRAAISDDGTRAITTAGDGIARVWELQSAQPRFNPIVSQYRSTRTCDISSDGQFVAATFYSGRRLPTSHFRGLVVLYQPETDSYLSRISVCGVPDKVKISRDATSIAVGCYGVKPAKNMARDNRITVFTRDGTEVAHFDNCFRDHDSCISWDFSDDGQVLAVCAQNRSAIHVYVNRDERTWKDRPLILSANIELTYEMCRIVDNGDLIAAIALDVHTDERSILVFRPRTGDILFSLACDLAGQKACLDLEPRVCYVAPTRDGPGRKVVRLLSKTPGDGSNTFELVRCGDPPKRALHGRSKSFDSERPSSSCDKTGVPTNPRGPPKADHSPQVARKLQDTLAPRPNSIEWSPARGSGQPVRTSSLPHDDKFKLRKSITKDKAVNCLSPLQSSPVVSPLRVPSNASSKKRTLHSFQVDVSAKKVQKSKKSPFGDAESSDSKQSSARKEKLENRIPNSSDPIVPTEKVQESIKAPPSESKQGSALQGSNKAPKSPCQSLQVSEKAYEASNTVLSSVSTDIAHGEMDRENAEKSHKSAIISDSKLPATPGQGQEQTITLKGEKVAPNKQTENAKMQDPSYGSDALVRLSETQKTGNGANVQALSNKQHRASNGTDVQNLSNGHHKAPNISNTQVLSKKPQKASNGSDMKALSNRQQKTPDAQDQSNKHLSATQKEITGIKNNETKELLQMITKPHDNINETKQKTATLNNSTTEQKDLNNTSHEMRVAPLPNLKKPRWQRARLLAQRRKKRENAALESTEENRTLATTEQENIKQRELGLSLQAQEQLRQEMNLSGKGGDRAGILKSSQPLESTSDRLVNGSTKPPPHPRDAATCSPPKLSPSCGQPETTKKLGSIQNGDKTNGAYSLIVPVNNLVALSYDKLLGTPGIQRHNIVENGTGRNRTPSGLRNDQMLDSDTSGHKLSGRSPQISQDRIITEATAKPEMVLDQSNTKLSPTTISTPNSMQLNSKASSSPELKTEPNESRLKNRCFESLERAKTRFRETSHKIEGGDKALSNVKAFKAILEVVPAESELLDRRVVAKIVYKMGGINNTLNETQFLEAFNHVYDELQGVRQRHWAIVYKQAAAGEGDGILIFHARDLIKQESSAMKLSLNPMWTDETLDELIASQAADEVLVSQDAFVQSTEKIFSV